MILRDDIAHHRKFILAGQQIGGPAGASRALAVWVGAIGYARTGLTNGIVHDAFLTNFSLDPDAKLIAKVLSLSRIRLFHRVRGGYRIHDFDEHNGSIDKMRRRRELARERQRRHRSRLPVENSNGGEPFDAVTPNVTRDKGRDLARARVEGKGKGVRTGASRVLSVSETPEVPKREQRPVGRATSAGANLTPQQTHDLTRAPAADGNYAVIEKLAHTVLEELHPTDPESPDVVETLKRKCAQLGINYTANPQIVRRALASVAARQLGAGRCVHWWTRCARRSPPRRSRRRCARWRRPGASEWGMEG